MTQLSFPFTLTAGTPENVNQLNSNLDAIKTVLNGGIAADNLTGSPAIPYTALTAPLLVTGLPGSPYNGQIIYFQAASGYVWTLRYSSSTTRWEFVGGSPMVSEVNEGTVLGSAAWSVVATTGYPPTITVPRPGVYLVEHGGAYAGDGTTSNSGQQAVFNAGVIHNQSLIQFATQAVWPNTASGSFQGSRKTLITAAAANAVFDVRNANLTGNSVNYQFRWLTVQPVYVT